MRIKIYLKGFTGLFLPKYHNHIVVGNLHRWLGDEKGYHGNKNTNWTFSSIYGGASRDNRIIYEREAFLFVSSPNQEFIKDLIKGIKDDPCFTYNKLSLNVDGLQFMADPLIDGNSLQVHVKSLYVKKFEGGKNTEMRLQDDGFLSRLNEITLKKMQVLSLPSDGFNITLLENEQPFSWQRKYKDFFHQVNAVSLKVTGREESLRFLYDSGLGNSTGIGYGYANQIYCNDSKQI